MKHRYDLSHNTITCGRIGMLQTPSVIPINAGDIISLSLSGIFRLSPLRLFLLFDPRLDIFAFYVPDRHVYGDTYISMMKGGIDATTYTMPRTNLGVNYQQFQIYGNPGSQYIPKAYAEGYNMIWNEYFRHPSFSADKISGDDRPSSTNQRLYGLQVCHLPRVWNTPVFKSVNDSDTHVDVDGANNDFDIIDLVKQKARLGSERVREFFSVRYRDVMMEIFNSRVSTDVDERPTLLARKNSYMSGYDVEGTAKETHGAYIGRTIDVPRFGFPKKFFGEHGMLWIMAAVRFPPVYTASTHYYQTSNGNTQGYRNRVADPDIMHAEPPIAFDPNSYFDRNNLSLTPASVEPYGQWHRYHNDRVHSKFVDAEQPLPLLQSLGNADQLIYVNDEDYDDIFQSDRFEHWNISAHINVNADRFATPASTSIFAGS